MAGILVFFIDLIIVLSDQELKKALFEFIYQLFGFVDCAKVIF